MDEHSHHLTEQLNKQTVGYFMTLYLNTQLMALSESKSQLLSTCDINGSYQIQSYY
jgi:hypothetical protein